jgi:hypothetical protein
VAYDSLGLTAVAERNVTVDNPPDNPPTVVIISPSPEQTVWKTVEVKANVTDDRGIEKVEFYLDTILKATVPGGTNPYTWNWDTTAYSNGSYTLEVRAYDTGGNTGSESCPVRIHNLGPGVSPEDEPYILITPNDDNINDYLITTGAKVTRIYTLDGKLIRLLENGIDKWKCFDDQGQPVSSGIYIFQIEDEEGNITTGKAVVAR